MRKFPDCFPKDFEQNILPQEAKENDFAVCRVTMYGARNLDSYFSTFEEKLKFGGMLCPAGKKISASHYSTSCFMSREALEATALFLTREISTVQQLRQHAYT